MPPREKERGKENCFTQDDGTRPCRRLGIAMNFPFQNSMTNSFFIALSADEFLAHRHLIQPLNCHFSAVHTMHACRGPIFTPSVSTSFWDSVGGWFLTLKIPDTTPPSQWITFLSPKAEGENSVFNVRAEQNEQNGNLLPLFAFLSVEKALGYYGDSSHISTQTTIFLSICVIRS